MTLNKKTSDYYFNVIDGKCAIDTEMFKGEPKEDWEALTIGYAFDCIEEIGDTSDVEKILLYIDDDIDKYSIRKDRALSSLGYLATNTTEVEKLLILYLGSDHPDLRFSAFCSICEMIKRKVISNDLVNFFMGYIEEKIITKKISHEEVIEIVLMLMNSSISKKEVLLGLALDNFPEAVNDAQQLFD